jgi:hypothetical protein
LSCFTREKANGPAQLGHLLAYNIMKHYEKGDMKDSMLWL